MRFEDVLGRTERSELSQMEAAELLGVSERTFRRWRERHREAGLFGLEDRRLHRSPRRAPLAEIERMLGLYRDLYRGFTVKHFHEQLSKRHASTHAWLPGDTRKYDLVVTLDDAASAICSAFLVEQEGTASSLRGMREVVERHGLFCALYTDRGSHYFLTPQGGGRVSRSGTKFDMRRF